MRQTATYPISDPEELQRRILHFAAAHEHAAVLFGHSGADGPVKPEWDLLAGIGSADVLIAQAGEAFPQLIDFHKKHSDWLFGYFGYDLKNEVENLQSNNFDGIALPDLCFWVPEVVLGLRNGRLEIHALGAEPDKVREALNQFKLPDLRPATSIELQPRIPREQYLKTTDIIRQHIIDGDVYELNFCQEFYAENADIEPVAVFERLQALSRAPFSVFLRKKDQYALSASPERFLKCKDRRLFSQPIKGTRRRGSTVEEDEHIKAELAASQKDRAENVMIVDLVRNDLARSCVPGSVVVDELFGIYSFQTVHQMISSVRGDLRPGVHPLEALKNAFPMGSMTGAPKVRAMQLIEELEETRRGLYSGAIGYITPSGDYDFNVVIRTILYNAAMRYVSASVGGAIVYDSIPEEEYKECLVKVEALVKSLGSATFTSPS